MGRERRSGSRSAFHLRQARHYAELAVAGLQRQGRKWRDDPVTAAGLTHLVESVAEYMGSIPAEVQARYPAVPWGEMSGFRNISAHEYHNVNLDIVESTIRDDLPKLIEQIDRMLADGI